MVLYHLLFDLVYFFDLNIPLFYSPALKTFIPFVSVTFIFVAGCCCNFSKNNLNRGLYCFGVAIAMTIITTIILPESPYLFGVLHLLGLSMVIYHFVGPVLLKIPTAIGLVSSLLITHITYDVSIGFLQFLWLKLYLPESLYQTNFWFPFGFYNSEFYSSDYFPLNPWLWCFFAGSYFGVWVKEKKLPNILYTSKPFSKILAMIGVNSMFIYIIHQPIIYSILIVIFYFIS